MGQRNGSIQECKKVMPEVSNAGGSVALAVAKSAEIIKKMRIFAVFCMQNTALFDGMSTLDISERRVPLALILQGLGEKADAGPSAPCTTLQSLRMTALWGVEFASG
jgi:hypothetical protein